MSDAFRVTLQTLQGGPTAVGAAGTHKLIVDRPVEGGGRGLGFNGGQLLYLAVGGCVSNDLYREAATQGDRTVGCDGRGGRRLPRRGNPLDASQRVR
jgi:uncharacterized OsmC-like protein